MDLHSRWQNSRIASQAVREQENYWLKEMEGEIPVLELPTDFPHPPVKRYEGARLPFHIDPGEFIQLKNLSQDTGATPFMVFLAVFNVLLSKLGRREDIIVGTPTAGRPHNDLQHIIGVFINTLALRNIMGPR